MKKSEPKAKSSTEVFDFTFSKLNKSRSKEILTPIKEQLLIEHEQPGSRLEEVEETLNAIHRGEVDAIAVSGPEDISWMKKKENELNKTEQFLQRQLEELNASQLTTMKLLKETEEAKNILEIKNQQLAKEIVGHKLAQKKLSDSEAKFKKLYEDGPLGMAMVNIDLHFVMANNNFCQMMGYNEQEIKRLTFKDITHPDNISIDFENLKKLVSGEIPVYKTERRYIRKDKTVIWGFLTVSVFRANDGKTRYFIAMVKDITDRKRNEETLQSSYSLLRIAGKSAKFGGWSFNIAENKFIWSDEVAAIHEMPSGYSPLFNEVINFYAQEWHNIFIASFNACKQNGIPYDEVLLLNTAKGNHLWVRLTGEALRDENENIIKVQGSIQDITELKWNEAVNESKMHLIHFSQEHSSYRNITDARRAEETLRRMNRQLQAISNCNQTLLRAADEQTLLNKICRIVCEEAGYRFAWVGYREHDDAKSIRFVTWAGVEEDYLKSTNISWSGKKFGGDPTGTAIRSGEITFIQNLSTYPREEIWCTNALHRGYQSCIALPLKDESANTFGALTIYSGEQDAFTPEEIQLLIEMSDNLAFGITALRIRTERKRVGESLWESSQMLNLVLNTMPSFVFWKDCNSVYQGCNYLFAANAGLSSTGEIVGMTDLDLPWKDSEAASYRNDDRMVIETGIPKINYEETQLTNDGRITWVRTSKIPLRNHEGDIIGVLGTFEDTSARRFAEEEIKKLNQTLEERVAQRTAQLEAINNELESFSYSISHDLRAPLRAISGFSQILSTRHRKTLNDQGRQYMDYIVEASLRMEQLINDLLDYSRLGRNSLDIKPIKLRKIIDNVHSDFKKKLDEIGAKFIIDKELPEVPGDESLFRQIFSNLIENAITYRRQEVQLEIKIEYKPKENGYILKITDNGIGIAREYWEKIFNVFQRLHSEDVYPGTGIGLATVRKALNILHGTIRVESVVGEGSSFIIYLIK